MTTAGAKVVFGARQNFFNIPDAFMSVSLVIRISGRLIALILALILALLIAPPWTLD
jgi:hypothetical protein